jgi:hypothetical protein
MEWAATKPEIKRYVCHADWETHGRAAGPIRNEKMLTWKPDLVVACPGGDGTADTFDQPRAAFEAAWQVFAANCPERDYQAWRDQHDWTAEKYRRFDRGEPMPRDWRAPHG